MASSLSGVLSRATLVLTVTEGGLCWVTSVWNQFMNFTPVVGSATKIFELQSLKIGKSSLKLVFTTRSLQGREG